MSVDDNATIPSTKRKPFEFIHQDDISESRAQKKIMTLMGKNQDYGSSESGEHIKKIKIMGRRSPKRGNANNWIRTRMPTVRPPPTELHLYENRQQRNTLRKILYETDLDYLQARLLLTRREVDASPLLELLLPEEHAAIFEEGLPVRVFDWYGKEFSMLFKYLPKTRAYRLIGQWTTFLRKNKWEMSPGNFIEVRGFRIVRNDGSTEIGMELHYVRVEMQEQKEAAPPAVAVYKNIKRREPKQKSKRIEPKNTQGAMIVAVAEQQIVSVEMESPTAKELLVAEALLLLNP